MKLEPLITWAYFCHGVQSPLWLGGYRLVRMRQMNSVCGAGQTLSWTSLEKGSHSQHELICSWAFTWLGRMWGSTQPQGIAGETFMQGVDLSQGRIQWKPQRTVGIMWCTHCWAGTFPSKALWDLYGRAPSLLRIGDQCRLLRGQKATVKDAGLGLELWVWD